MPITFDPNAVPEPSGIVAVPETDIPTPVPEITTETITVLPQSTEPVQEPVMEIVSDPVPSSGFDVFISDPEIASGIPCCGQDLTTVQGGRERCADGSFATIGNCPPIGPDLTTVQGSGGLPLEQCADGSFATIGNCPQVAAEADRVIGPPLRIDPTTGLVTGGLNLFPPEPRKVPDKSKIIGFIVILIIVGIAIFSD